MCKAIYWIDDSTQGIMNIVHSVFPYLWDLEGKREGIETHVQIIGNGEQVTTGTSLWSKEDERKSSQAIMRMLERLCKNGDRMNQQKLYAKKKDLIENKFKIVYKSDDNDISEYRKLCSAWQDNNQITSEAQDSVKKLFKRMEIKKGACVGLDLALLKGDIDKVRKREQPILSMELYRLIKEDHECFLYSKYVYDKSFVEKWEDVYLRIYNETEIPTIHRRSELYAKNLLRDKIDELVDMVNESYKKKEEENVTEMD